MGVNSCHWSVDVRNICLFVCLFPNPVKTLSDSNHDCEMEVIIDGSHFVESSIVPSHYMACHSCDPFDTLVFVA